MGSVRRLVLRHLSGSHVNHVDEFLVQGTRELLIGRDRAAQICYDDEIEDLVGRRHARIVQDQANPSSFLLLDLDSLNGTFLNRGRVMGRLPLEPEDVVQFGLGGPELQFDIVPRPPGSTAGSQPAFAASEAPGSRPAPIDRPSPVGSKKAAGENAFPLVAPRTVLVIVTLAGLLSLLSWWLGHKS